MRYVQSTGFFSGRVIDTSFIKHLKVNGRAMLISVGERKIVYLFHTFNFNQINWHR